MAHLLVSLKSAATIVEGFLRQPKAIDKITLIMWNLAGFRGVEPELPWLRIGSGPRLPSAGPYWAATSTFIDARRSRPTTRTVRTSPAALRKSNWQLWS